MPDQPYQRILMEQGSVEWHAWRSTGIGASDAPVIMGENPWKEPYELAREKRAPRRSRGESTKAMRLGVHLEPHARIAYCTKLGKTVEPACLQSTQYSWLRASVDGLSPCSNHLVEIKCGEKVYGHASRTGAPPDYYYGQLQHTLAVTGSASIDFWCFLPRLQPVHLVIERNDKYIKRMLEAEEAFYDQHLKMGSVSSVGDLM